MESLKAALNIKTLGGLVTFEMQDGSRIDIDHKTMAKERKMIDKNWR